MSPLLLGLLIGLQTPASNRVTIIFAFLIGFFFCFVLMCIFISGRDRE